MEYPCVLLILGGSTFISIWMSHKRIFGSEGCSAIPTVFLALTDCTKDKRIRQSLSIHGITARFLFIMFQRWDSTTLHLAKGKHGDITPEQCESESLFSGMYCILVCTHSVASIFNLYQFVSLIL